VVDAEAAEEVARLKAAWTAPDDDDVVVAGRKRFLFY
jgi:hypothetical protein